MTKARTGQECDSVVCNVRSGEPVPGPRAAAEGNNCVVSNQNCPGESGAKRKKRYSLVRAKQTTELSRLSTLSWHERGACSEVP